MIFSKKKEYRKRTENSKFPRGKTFSYRSARRSPSGLSEDTNSRDENAYAKKEDEEKKPGKISKLLNIIIVLAIFSSLIYLTYANTDPVIELDGKILPRNEADYYNSVKSEMNNSVFYKNKLTFNTEKFEQDIKAEFPEIESVIIEMPVFRHRPTVNISFLEPSARLVTKDKSYILDKEGRALFPEDRINDQLETSSLVSINDASGHPIVLGKPVLTERQINYIREIINQSNANNVPAQTFNLQSGGSAVDIKFKDAAYKVIFSFYEDPRQSSGAYFSIREEISNGKAPKPEKYIDLRIPDRAYIK